MHVDSHLDQHVRQKSQIFPVNGRPQRFVRQKSQIFPVNGRPQRFDDSEALVLDRNST